MTTTRRYDVPGISCGHCKMAIEGELSRVEDVDSAIVDIEGRTVSVEGTAPEAAVVAAIEEAGYEVASTA